MNDDSASVVVFFGVAAVGLFLTAAVWGGVHLAVLVTTGSFFSGSFGDALHAMVRYPAMPPAQAWDSSVVPGPVVVYGSTVLVAVFEAVVGFRIGSLLKVRSGFSRRKNLGVNPEACFAKPGDLRPLWCKRPLDGRFLLGRTRSAGARLLATEWRANPGVKIRGKAARRQNDRGAVAFIGPSRQGKSVAMIAGVLDWSGPAVLSSVKDDLLAPTLPHRRRQGECAVYDPTGFLAGSYSGTRNGPPGWDPDLVIGWSPLAGIVSFDDAQRAAKAVVDSAPQDNIEGSDFWMAQVEMLLAGLFWIAAYSDHSLEDVVRWIVTQDKPSDTNDGEVQRLLDVAKWSAETDQEKRWVNKTSDLLNGLWGNGDEEQARTVGSIYATARTAIKPWLSENAALSAERPSVTLDWLISGTNTLYLAAPPHDQKALAPAFGGMLNGLIEQAFRHVAKHGPISPPLLIVLDEAAQTPLKQLPEWVSTVAGLGIQIVTAWQSIAQIKTTYKSASDTILTNHLTKVFFGAQSDGDALDYIAKVLGDEAVRTTTPSHDLTKLFGGSIQETEQRVAIAPANVARQMEAFTALMIHGALPPAHINIIKYFKERHYNSHLRWTPGDNALGLPTLNKSVLTPTPAEDTQQQSMRSLSEILMGEITK